MSNADVMRAGSLSGDLVRWESRGPGDTGNAMRRIATRSAVPFGKLWALRYRPPKAIASHVLARIEAAHAAAVRHQLERLAHDVPLTAAVAGPDHAAVRAGEALLRAAGGGDPAAGPRVARPLLAAAPADPPVVSDLPLWRAAERGE